MSLFSSPGRKPNTNVKNYWGTRVIFTDGIISSAYCRRDFIGDLNQAGDFLEWLRTEFYPQLDEQAKLLYHDQNYVLTFESKDGRFHGEASCQNSYKYLYIGCWEKI